MSEFIKIKANKNSLSGRGLTYGVGINDSWYKVQPKILGKQMACPIYKVWKSMLERCYDSKFKKKNRTYIDCIVCSEWHTFSVFSLWMEKQDWKDKQLDKDIIIPGNKVYGPSLCVFVTAQINKLLISQEDKRGDLPQGVHIHRILKTGETKYRAACNTLVKKISLGVFFSVNEAEIAYCNFKSELITTISYDSSLSLSIKNGLLGHAAIFKSRSMELMKL